MIKKLSIYFLFLFYFVRLVNSQNDNLMLINFIRHGNRTPGKIFPEIKDLFHKMDEKKLTLSGFQQMNISGKIYRKRYMESNLIKLNQIDMSHEYLIISSPSPRSIESSIAFSMGLFPDKIYKIYDYNHLSNKRDSNPPLNNPYEEEFDYFNLIIEKKIKNTLFHVKKCKFGNNEFPKNKNYSYFSLKEKKIVFEYLKEHFPQTLKNISFDKFSDKLARSIYSSMRIVNKHYKKKFIIPSHVELILKKILSHYSYFAKISNDEGSRMMSSAFFHHMVKLFDHRINNHINSQLLFLNRNFYKSMMSCIKSNLDFLPVIENEDYSHLKFVTYSGHDGNIAGILRNFLSDDQLNEYFKNFGIFKKLVHISFGASVDFMLHFKNGEYYVKILFNGEELFDKIRSYYEGEYLNYDSLNGIKYEEFRKFLLSRMFSGIETCKTEEI
jgi:hypothetical protein